MNMSLQYIDENFIKNILKYENSKWFGEITNLILELFGNKILFNVEHNKLNGVGVILKHLDFEFYLNDYDFQIKKDKFEIRFEEPVHKLIEIRFFLIEHVINNRN